MVAEVLTVYTARRHIAYVKEFGKDKLKGRKALIPFLF